MIKNREQGAELALGLEERDPTGSWFGEKQKEQTYSKMNMYLHFIIYGCQFIFP